MPRSLIPSSILIPCTSSAKRPDLHAQGSLSIKGNHQLDFAANGAINLKLAETLDPDLTANGNTTFQLEAHGPMMTQPEGPHRHPERFSLPRRSAQRAEQLHGSLEFSQNRLEIKSLTAMTGGGQLSLAGYLPISTASTPT